MNLIEIFFLFLSCIKINCHKDIINCLLDYGADVNKLNYEGLSPLAACHVLFYTKHTWNENIGENLTKENLFNSVHWDKQSGTFVQRKPIYHQNRTRSKIEAASTSQSSINSATGSNQENLTDDMPKKLSNTSRDSTSRHGISGVDNTMTIETEENVKAHTATDSENVCGKIEGHLNSDEDKTNGLVTCLNGDISPEASQLNCAVIAKETHINRDKIHNDQTRKIITEEDIPNDQQDIPSNYHSGQCFEPGLEHQTSLYDIGYTQPAQVSNIKESIVQRSEIVDKNTFIHIFLNRAASARSKQNSVNSYCDTRDDVHYNQYETSWNLNEKSNRKTGLEKGNISVAITAPEPDLQESTQYSMQNAISSSIHTTNTVEDTDSVKSVEQNRQKLITQQRYILNLLSIDNFSLDLHYNRGVRPQGMIFISTLPTFLYF